MIKFDKIGILQTSAFLLAIGGITYARQNIMQREAENFKNKIHVNDSARYNRVIQKTQNKPIQIKNEAWEKAYIEMQDSLHKAGIAEKNYFEGSQAARIK